MNVIEELTQMGYKEQAQALKSMEEQSILLKTAPANEEDFSIGETKIGGTPHLPKDFAWPMFNKKPLAFIAQINLDDVATYDTENRLPKSGLLSFFYEGGEEVWGYDPKDKGGFKVVHFEQTENLQVTSTPDTLEDYMVFSPCKITFECAVSYPSDTYELNKQLFGDSDSDEHEDFFEVIYDAQEGIVNKLFGHPGLIQGDIFLETQLVTNGLFCGNSTGYNDPRAKELEKGVSDWMLLFQIDSDNNANMMWGDVGRVYFTIKKEDLANGNFDNIWTVFQCC